MNDIHSQRLEPESGKVRCPVGQNVRRGSLPALVQGLPRHSAPSLCVLAAALTSPSSWPCSRQYSQSLLNSRSKPTPQREYVSKPSCTRSGFEQASCLEPPPGNSVELEFNNIALISSYLLLQTQSKLYWLSIHG